MRRSRLVPWAIIAVAGLLPAAGYALRNGGAAINSVTRQPEAGQFDGRFGASVAWAGDVNGDGFGDVIVGAPLQDGAAGFDAGSAYLFYGSAAGVSETAGWSASGDQIGAWFGAAVAGAGDVNADGFPDVIIGARLRDGDATDEGRAYLYLGSAEGLSALPAWTADGNEIGGTFGHAVAGAGDVNGDGFGDVIVGAPMADGAAADEGRAFVFFGSALGLEAAPAWSATSGIFSSAFGHAVAGAGDVDGDGFADVLVGAPLYDAGGFFDQGRVALFPGGSGGPSADPSWTAGSDRTFGHMGQSVAAAGDVNGDGFADFLAGAPGFDYGRAFLWLGGPAGPAADADWMAKGSRTIVELGAAVAGAGDRNGDGFSDVVVGAPRAGSRDHLDEGWALVFLGSDGGLPRRAAATIESDQPGAALGSAVAGGDTNGDGFSETIAGAPRYTGVEQFEGRVFVDPGSGAPR